MFIPDYKNIVDAALNKRPARIPLYEHNISIGNMEKVLNCNFSGLYSGNASDKKEFFKKMTEFFVYAGYDMMSIEFGLTSVMPGANALSQHVDPVIKTRDDFNKYPWDNFVDDYFKSYKTSFQMIREVLPLGMKIIGGIGGGVFESVQNLASYVELCYMSQDDPELYADLFIKVGDIMTQTWTRLLDEFSDIFAVARFGDDLGFKTQTLIPEDDIRKHIIPQYKRVIQVVHNHNLPFLLHSCGQIFGVLGDIIRETKIDAKHSNEEGIAPYSRWVEMFGDKIGIFGGIDTDILCRGNEDYIKNFVREMLEYLDKAKPNGGFALGSGNSIPDYVPVENYMAMVNMVREYRGDFKK
jgi:uroporphyrinogen decarboxylase